MATAVNCMVVRVRGWVSLLPLPLNPVHGGSVAVRQALRCRATPLNWMHAYTPPLHPASATLPTQPYACMPGTPQGAVHGGCAVRQPPDMAALQGHASALLAELSSALSKIRSLQDRVHTLRPPALGEY